MDRRGYLYPLAPVLTQPVKKPGFAKGHARAFLVKKKFGHALAASSGNSIGCQFSPPSRVFSK